MNTTQSNVALEALQFSIDGWVKDGGTNYSAAEKIGISAPALSNVLRGLRPTESQKAKIEKAFGVPVASWTK